MYSLRYCPFNVSADDGEKDPTDALREVVASWDRDSKPFQLDMSGRKDVKIIPPLAEFAHLIELNCKHCILRELPSLPRSLERLNCCDSQVAFLPDDLHLCVNLVQLSCCYNQLTVLPLLPPKLRTLSCSHNEICQLPTPLPETLRNVFCHHNEIRALPENLPSHLEYFFCSHNLLAQLPAVSHTNLATLDCSANCLRTLPPLPQTLRQLNFKCNQISGTFVVTDNVEVLYCEHNQLTHIVANSPKCALERLYCNHNQLVFVDKFPQLSNLICRNNRLTSLPHGMNWLEYVICDHNQITHLYGMERVYYLNAGQNPLRAIFGELTRLRTLFIDDTDLFTAFANNKGTGSADANNAALHQDGHVTPRVFFHWNAELNRCRERIFLQKLRKPLRAWLWERVRRPKVERVFHHEMLDLQLLMAVQSGEDEDAVLAKWNAQLDF
jgi:Leucine-rich repeat (LRR) protein